MPNAIIGWDLRRLSTTRHTPLTGDVRTVAVPNAMQTASVDVLRQQMVMFLRVFLLFQTDPSSPAKKT